MSLISERFFKGEYAQLVSEYADTRALSASAERDRAYLVGALVFVGRRSDAVAEAKLHLSDARTDTQVIARFFLGVGACRDSDYVQAKQCFSQNYRLRHQITTVEARFYVDQGLGFFRYFCSRFAKSARWSARAWRTSYTARFHYGMTLSADLRGHALAQTGQISAALQSFGLAANHASGGVKEALDMSTLGYRAQYGLLRRASRHLRAKLDSVSLKDTYSRANLVLEMVRQLIYEGKSTQALSALEDFASEIFRFGHRRQKAVWLARKAEIFRRQGREYLGLVEQGLKLLDLEIDLAQRLELERLLEKCTLDLVRRLGIAPSPDSPLKILEDRLRRDPQDLEALLSAEKFGWRGLFQLVVEPEQGLIMYLDLMPGRLVIFWEGDVFVSKGQVTEILKRILLSLTQGHASKQSLVEAVWGYKYSSLRHDGMFYNTIYRLRQLLGKFESFLVATENGYSWKVKAFARVFERPIPARSLPSPGLSPDLNLRQHRALRHLRSAEALSVGEYAKTFKIAKATATRDLAEMVNKGYLSRAGRARATVYVLAANVLTEER